MDYTGQKIEKYQVKRLIGEGGMASVYEAEHEILGTKAAIKILNPVLSANKQIRERFINEARVMASFEHPNIAKIIDFEENDAFLAIIMEFLEGQDLSDRIEKGPRLTDQEIVSIFEQTLSAFQYAHEKGVVHRDIKPSNIYILPNGKVKILDFGIAKLFGQGNEMTQTGTQMGTPIYMSPEQVKGDKSIDHRSDIYSLGVTLFYALNGKPPYDSDNGSQFEIFNKIVYEPLPALIGDSPLIPLVQKACEKDREKRFQSCDEWLDEFNKMTFSKDDESNVSEKTVFIASKKETSRFDETLKESKAKTKDNENIIYSDGDSTEKKDLKLLKIITIIQLILFGWFGFCSLRILNYVLIFEDYYWSPTIYQLPKYIGIIIIPVNIIFSIILFKKLLFLGKTKNELVLSIICSPILFVFSEYIVFGNFFRLEWLGFYFVLLPLIITTIELAFHIRTLIRIANANKEDMQAQPNKLAISSFILGIICFLLTWKQQILDIFHITGFILAIFSVVIGLISQKEKNNLSTSKKSLGIIGLVLGSITAIFFLLRFLDLAF